MQLNDKIREDIEKTLFEAKTCLFTKNHEELKRVSDTVIHNSSVFQDEESIEVAITLYSLAKVLEKKTELTEQFYHLFTHIEQLFKRKQYHAYKKAMAHLLCKIKEVDQNTQQYAKHVINHAKVNKGSRLFHHGISLGQSACAMGISQWELYDYVGKTHSSTGDTKSVRAERKRMAYAQLLTKHKNNTVVFDAGPIITSTMNGILHILPKLKKIMNADFLIPNGVYNEVIEKPMKTKKYKLEAYRVISYINDGTFHHIKQKYLKVQTKKYLDLINTAYSAFGNPITIVHEGEMQALALLKMIGGRTLVIDERTTRYLMESPKRVVERLSRKLHTKITVDQDKVDKFHKEFEDITAIRSTELMTLAYEHGLFNEMIEGMNGLDDSNYQFYEGLLWGLKLAGVGISEREIAYLQSKLKK